MGQHDENVPHVRTGETRKLLWRAQWNTSDPDAYDAVFTVVYRVAARAIQCLIQENLIPAPPPPLPTRQWTTVAENFRSHFKPKYIPKLHGVSHFSFDTEGRGHVPYDDTFFQLGIWYNDGTCEVYMDYLPSKWLTMLSIQVRVETPDLQVVTWDTKPIAKKTFGTPQVQDIQTIMGPTVADELGIRLQPGTTLGLKAAFRWVARRRHEPEYEYPKPKRIDGTDLASNPVGCWKYAFPHKLSDEHRKYAAVDAYATAALWSEWLRMKQ